MSEKLYVVRFRHWEGEGTPTEKLATDEEDFDSAEARARWLASSDADHVEAVDRMYEIPKD